MKKVESLQAFRAIAFLFVFLSHTELCPTGSIGVSMFLVLSGFLMALSNYRKPLTEPVTFRSSARFAVRKISKLYLLHMITLVMMLAYTILLLWKDGFPTAAVRETVIALPLNALLLQTWIPSESIYFTFNKVSWYLSVCLFIYFVFPACYNKLRRLAVPHLSLAGIGIIIIQVFVAALVNYLLPDELQYRITKWVAYICPLFRCGDFFLGCILGLVCIREKISDDRIHKNSFLFSSLEVLWAVVCILLLMTPVRKMIPAWLRHGIVWLPISLIGVYLFYKKSGLLTKLLSNKLLIEVGNMSAYAFLIHQMTIHLVKFVIKDVYVLSAVSIVVTLLLSFVYEKFENRLLMMKKRKCTQKR